MSAYLILASDAEALAIGSMAEGRLAVLADDGLSDTPAARGLRDVIEWLWAATADITYPTRLPLDLGSAQAEQLRITIENVADQGDGWDADDDDETEFTAHIEEA